MERLSSRYLKFIDQKHYLGETEEISIDDREDLSKAIASLETAFSKADGKKIFLEVWKPVVPTIPLKPMSPRVFPEKKGEILIGDRKNLDEAVAFLKGQFTKAGKKTLLCEIWTPVTIGGRRDVPVKLKPHRKEKHGKEKQRV